MGFTGPGGGDPAPTKPRDLAAMSTRVSPKTAPDRVQVTIAWERTPGSGDLGYRSYNAWSRDGPGRGRSPHAAGSLNPEVRGLLTALLRGGPRAARPAGWAGYGAPERWS